MTGEVEALGGLATAGLATAALDPPPATRHIPAHADCANCGAALTGAFCAACGQSAHLHRSVGHVVEEFLHGVWHFDSKAWRTLPLLVFRPGKLTREYVHGRRFRYIAPLALFLLSVFLMFFVFGFIGGPNLDDAVVLDGKSDRISAARDAVKAARSEVAAAENALAGVRTGSDDPPAAIEADETGLAAKRAALRAADTALANVEGLPADAPKKIFRAKSGQSWQEAVAEQARAGQIDADTGIPAVDANIRKALKDPEFAFYKVQQKAYKLSFLLVPLSLPVLWLMFFWRRDVKLYDHVVFSLYSLSFMSLLLIVGVAVPKIADQIGLGMTGAGLLFIAPPVHMFAQLKGAYALGKWGALWRTWVLVIASIVTLSLFAALIVILGLAD